MPVLPCSAIQRVEFLVVQNWPGCGSDGDTHALSVEAIAAVDSAFGKLLLVICGRKTTRQCCLRGNQM